MKYWNPIETAPRSGAGHEGRDGPDLLLLLDSGAWHRGCWIGKPISSGAGAGWMIDGGSMPKNVIGWHLPPTTMEKDEPTVGKPGEVLIDYTNYRGERRHRRIVPHSISFDWTTWHPKKQWLLKATDVEVGANREFAMNDIHSWKGIGS